MKKAAADLNFEAAAELRDKMTRIEEDLAGDGGVRTKNGYKDRDDRQYIQDPGRE